MNLTRRRGSRGAFSLIEVVVATAIFATAIVAVIGLLSPMTKRVTDVIDSETAARLAAAIQDELQRIGFAAAETITEGPPGTAVLLVANADASRVRLASGPAPPADGALNDPTLPGLAMRDRYFLIRIVRQEEVLAYTPAVSGALALRAEVIWPYQISVGPKSDTNTASGVGSDEFALVPAEQHQRLLYFFAIRP